MKKKKYMKPISKNLSSLEVSSGSCVSGKKEYTVVGPCVEGAAALGTCDAGGAVLNPTFCNPGGNAGYSCVYGTEAG